MPRIMCYDTESTGLPKRTLKAPPTIADTIDYPYVVQLSYIVYDTENHEVLKVYDQVIKIPESAEIHPEAEKLHKITKELTQSEGISMKDAIAEFMHDFNSVDTIVGHNIQFDNNIMLVEILRNVTENFEWFHEITQCTRFSCTMLRSINLCAIKTCYKNSTKTYNKYPKLSELYHHLFQQTPTKLHNSLNDVILCLQCYCMLEFNLNICFKNEQLAGLIHATF